jgi:acyl-coenzyme A thioesterase PaaI-like protein
MTVSFVRAILEKTGQLRCEGKVIHVGGRIATAEARLWDAGGVLLAHGSETCMILKPGNRST